MHGIGDNISQRCFIKALANLGKDIYLKTPIPELYSDIPGIKFIRANSSLRTQKRNEDSSKMNFVTAPRDVAVKRIFYGNAHLSKGSIFDAMTQQFGILPTALDLPHYELPDIGIPASKPVALIRPTTERTEWHNASRGPLNKYVDDTARLLSEKGFYVVSIADLQAGYEWIPGDEPFADLKLHKGELTITQMLALVEHADIVVTGACVIMHAAIAYRRPMICLQGGNGGNNHHRKVTCDACMDLSQSLFVYPDNYCMCQEMKHSCDKTITGLKEKVLPFIDRVWTSYTSENA